MQALSPEVRCEQLVKAAKRALEERKPLQAAAKAAVIQRIISNHPKMSNSEQMARQADRILETARIMTGESKISAFSFVDFNLSTT